MGVTRFHLIRTFKQVYGQTPHKFLLALRLARAKSILSGDGRKVIEAGFDSGFADLSTFNKAFKRVYGYCPQKALRASNSSVK